MVTQEKSLKIIIIFLRIIAVIAVALPILSLFVPTNIPAAGWLFFAVFYGFLAVICYILASGLKDKERWAWWGSVILFGLAFLYDTVQLINNQLPVDLKVVIRLFFTVIILALISKVKSLF